VTKAKEVKAYLVSLSLTPQTWTFTQKLFSSNTDRHTRRKKHNFLVKSLIIYQGRDESECEFHDANLFECEFDHTLIILTYTALCICDMLTLHSLQTFAIVQQPNVEKNPKLDFFW